MCISCLFYAGYQQLLLSYSSLANDKGQLVIMALLGDLAKRRVVGNSKEFPESFIFDQVKGRVRTISEWGALPVCWIGRSHTPCS